MPRASTILAAFLAAVAPAALAAAQTFANPASISIPSAGAGNPYPSTITVSGVSTPASSVSVTLRGISHTFAADLDILLVGPGGQGIWLLSDVVGSGDLVNADLVITDNAPLLPTSVTNLLSGVYAPTNIAAGPADALPAPAPGPPYAGSLASFNSSPNGVWSLYVFDDDAGVSGQIARGWSLTFNTLINAPAPIAFTYQGKLDPVPAAPVDLRFTLHRSADPAAFSPAVTRIGAPLEVPGVTPAADGTFTLDLSFGATAFDAEARWLQVEVRSPAGAGPFVPLTPRQPITPAPQARWAANAENAANADLATLATSATTAASATTATNATNATNAINATNAQTAAVAQSLAGPGVVPTSPGATDITNLLAFGAIGDGAVGAENSDLVAFQRLNTANDQTTLRLYIGDNGATPINALTDGFQIGVRNVAIASRFGVLFSFTSDAVAAKVGGGAWAALSDPAAKHDAKPLAGTLDKLLTLRGYSFLYNDEFVAAGEALPGPQVGLMADEVERVFPDWVTRRADGLRQVSERSTTALMVEALRDLRAEKDAQLKAKDAELAELRAAVAELRHRLDAVERADEPAK